METLQRLTRRQLDALQATAMTETPERGASLIALARRLKVRSPSALEHLTPLEGLGLVDRYRGKTRLTVKGRACLLEYQRHHRVAELLFARAGFTADETCRAAKEIDLALDHATVERMCRGEGHPAACPHGEPIPPCGHDRDGR